MKTLKENLRFTLGFVGIIWAVFLINLILPFDLNDFGIYPRTIRGLLGIALMPFLHGNIVHILGNTIALFSLMMIGLVHHKERMIAAIFISALVSGIGIWLFGMSGVHIGASGIVLGLIGYLIFSGIYNKRPGAIITSVIVFVLYGGAAFISLIPIPYVSWTGHAFGFIGGVIAAKKII